MNKETYEALKRIVDLYKNSGIYIKDSLVEGYVKRVEKWIDEVAKEYEKNIGQCDNQNCIKIGKTELLEVKMNKDFENDTALWCKDCIERDKEMLEED